MRISLLYFLLLIALCSARLGAQTAYDFTLTDCCSNSQHLFAILEKPKVVVLIYEHQCATCLAGATNVSNVINTYYSGDTNIIVMYLDNGGNLCASTASWITTNSLVSGPCFEYSSNFSSPYGSGMPVIAIAAGISHHVYLSATNPSTTTAIHNAITAALSDISGIEQPLSQDEPLTVFPTLVNNGNIEIDWDTRYLQISSVAIFDISGNRIFDLATDQNSSGINKKNIDVSRLKSGIYYIRLSANSGIIGKRFMIAE